VQKEALFLSIGTEDGKLFVLLSDKKRLSKLGWARTDLSSIKSVAAAVPPAVLQELIFPESISLAIEQSNAESLLVQIEPELAYLPIDEFQSADQRWCERYAMSCFLTNLAGDEQQNSSPDNSHHDQLQIAFTHKLSTQNQTTILVEHFTSSGLFFAHNNTLQNASTMLIAASADDAITHINNGPLCNAPQICAWLCETSFDTATDSSIVDIGQFSHQFPAISVLTGRNFKSVEEFIIALIPALCMIKAGLSPLYAVQSALQNSMDKKHTLRLYNCDDIALCQPRSKAPLATENRTITAMSLDVVASTQMIHRLGNERYSEVLAALKERCINCIYERGGSSGGRAGDDSTMAYFGLPNALENTAACAMDTALAVRELLPTLPGQPELRIGISTGRVAVRSGIPYGETIHLAARLQSYGQAGDIIVDTASQWLARHQFDFEPCGDYTELHGIEHPVLPVRLIAHANAKAHKTNTDNAAPFVGRAIQLMELVEYWQRVCQGEQHVVCVRGEAGIGKSRLVSEFLKKVSSDSAMLIRVWGLSDYKGGAFYSLQESLRRGFGIQAGDTSKQIEKRIRKVASYPLVTVQNMVHIAQLLGICDSEHVPDTEKQAPQDGTEISTRDRIFALLTEAIKMAAKVGPLVVMVEDLQWIDPSAREALDHVIQTLNHHSGLHLLILCAERDDPVGADAADQALPFAKTMSLNRLPSEISHQFIRRAVGESVATSDVDQLVARAEGVPLFLEESARLALDQSTNPRNSLFTVPDSIDSLLMSRLDNLDESGRYLVQIASVIGRDVQIELIRSVLHVLSDSSEQIDFSRQLKAFREIGVLSDSKAKGLPRLNFRHEMFRDVAYSSMWQRDRITVHAAVAQVMRDDKAQLFAGQPSMVAHHLSLSNQHEQAAIQWEMAARQAADASANQEAIYNLRAALASLENVANNEHNAKQEMRLQLMLAARLLASEGYGAEEVKNAYQRAGKLVHQFGSQRDQLKVMLGLESVHVMRGELQEAEKLACSALDIAATISDSKLRMSMVVQARWALGNIKFHQGHPNKALSLMDECLHDCSAIKHRSFAVQDPQIMCLCYGAWALWEKGLADSALQRIDEAVNLARTRQHRFSEAEALGFYASVALFRGEYSVAIAYADNAIEICEQEKFVIWLAHAMIIRGRSMALLNNPSDALQQMEQGYEKWISSGAVITRAFYLSLIAETLLETGQFDSAKARIEEAYDIITTTNDRYHLAEVCRVQGLIAYATHQFSKGDAYLREGIGHGVSQQKHAFVLRASIALAESLASRDHQSDAIAWLEKALCDLSEGLSNTDVVRARNLLGHLTHTPGIADNLLISQQPQVDSSTQQSGNGALILPFPNSASK